MLVFIRMLLIWGIRGATGVFLLGSIAYFGRDAMSPVPSWVTHAAIGGLAVSLITDILKAAQAKEYSTEKGFLRNIRLVPCISYRLHELQAQVLLLLHKLEGQEKPDIKGLCSSLLVASLNPPDPLVALEINEDRLGQELMFFLLRFERLASRFSRLKATESTLSVAYVESEAKRLLSESDELYLIGRYLQDRMLSRFGRVRGWSSFFVDAFWSVSDSGQALEDEYVTRTSLQDAISQLESDLKNDYCLICERRLELLRKRIAKE